MFLKDCKKKKTVVKFVKSKSKQEHYCSVSRWILIIIIMHTTGIIRHFDHSNMYTNTSSTYIYIYTSPCYEFPLLIPSSTYLAPSRCDWNCPPQSQVARKLTPLVPHCSLVPSPPNSQPFLDFPEPNVYLIRAHHKPPSQHTTELFCFRYQRVKMSFPEFVEKRFQ
jgi:hypothetical protein